MSKVMMEGSYKDFCAARYNALDADQREYADRAAGVLVALWVLMDSIDLAAELDAEDYEQEEGRSPFEWQDFLDSMLSLRHYVEMEASTLAGGCPHAVNWRAKGESDQWGEDEADEPLPVAEVIGGPDGWDELAEGLEHVGRMLRKVIGKRQANAAV